jgi:hypothetical protein
MDLFDILNKLPFTLVLRHLQALVPFLAFLSLFLGLSAHVNLTIQQ